MKTIIASFLITITFFGFTANNTFEGTMTLSRDSESGSSLDKINLTIKNDKVAIEVPDGKTPKMVVDVTTGDMFTTMKQGSQPMVIKMNLGTLNKIGGLPVLLGPTYSKLLGRDSEGKTTVEQTSEVKTIDGYKCSQYVIKSEDHTGTVWATKELPFDFSRLFEMIGESENAGEFYSSIPLEGTLKELETGKTTNFSLKAKEQVVDDSAFAFPAEYTEMDMTPLLKQLMENGDPAQIKQVLGNILQK